MSNERARRPSTRIVVASLVVSALVVLAFVVHTKPPPGDRDVVSASGCSRLVPAGF